MSAQPRHPDRLAEWVAAGAFPPGWQLTHVREVGSTQDLARAAAARGAPSRSAFVADFQSAGRGRQGRQWVAPPGSALLVSLLFRETGGAPAPQRFTMLVSLSLAEAVEAVAPGLYPRIKWPNDLMLGDRKLAGVLAESAWDGEQLLVIVGAGTNVGLTLRDLAPLGGAATSLAVEAGAPVDRADLLRALLGRVDAWLPRSTAEIHAAWHERLWGRGQRLRLRGLGGSEEERYVVVLGSEADGSLRVRLDDGAEIRTTVGELIL